MNAPALQEWSAPWHRLIDTWEGLNAVLQSRPPEAPAAERLPALVALWERLRLPALVMEPDGPKAAAKHWSEKAAGQYVREAVAENLLTLLRDLESAIARDLEKAAHPALLRTADFRGGLRYAHLGWWNNATEKPVPAVAGVIASLPPAHPARTLVRSEEL